MESGDDPWIAQSLGAELAAEGRSHAREFEKICDTMRAMTDSEQSWVNPAVRMWLSPAARAAHDCEVDLTRDAMSIAERLRWLTLG